MATRIMQDRHAEVSQAAATLGATIADSGERNWWEITLAGKRVGDIRYEPPTRVWLATTGIESTVGDLTGCLRFVIRRN